VAHELWTATAAAMAVPSRPTGAVPRHLFGHGHCLVFAQQTTGLVRCGTLMRHVICVRAIAACSRCVIDTAAPAHLITATGFALRLWARFPSAAFGAVKMAAITMAADQYLDLAAAT
jgi:hypothetical protein